MNNNPHMNLTQDKDTSVCVERAALTLTHTAVDLSVVHLSAVDHQSPVREEFITRALRRHTENK